MKVQLYAHPLSRDDDVVIARRSAARFAATLFARPRQSNQIAICVSELARNTLNHGGGGDIEFNVVTDVEPMLFEIRTRNSDAPALGVASSGFGVGLKFVERAADSVIYDKGVDSFDMSVRFELDGEPAECQRRVQAAVELSNQFPASPHLLEKRNHELLAHMETIARREKAARLLLGVVGHDIRNPLAVIQMSLDMAIRRTDDESTRSLLARAKRAAKQALQLASDITDFTAEELSSGWELRRTRFDVIPAARALMSDFEALHPERTWVLEHDEAMMMSVDPARFLQALTNLFQNAAKYSTRNGEVRVELIQGDEREPDRVRVSNPSLALESAVLETLFDPFARDDDSVGHKPGLGLGLYTVRTVAEKHGGLARATYEDGVFAIEVTFDR
jgi:signal transduction histidine kinase